MFWSSGWTEKEAWVLLNRWGLIRCNIAGFLKIVRAASVRQFLFSALATGRFPWSFFFVQLARTSSPMYPLYGDNVSYTEGFSQVSAREF